MLLPLFHERYPAGSAGPEEGPCKASLRMRPGESVERRHSSWERQVVWGHEAQRPSLLPYAEASAGAIPFWTGDGKVLPASGNKIGLRLSVAPASSPSDMPSILHAGNGVSITHRSRLRGEEVYYECLLLYGHLCSRTYPYTCLANTRNQFFKHQVSRYTRT